MLETACPHSGGLFNSPVSLCGSLAHHQFVRMMLLPLIVAFGVFCLGSSSGQAQTFTDSGFVAETVTTLPIYEPVGLTFAPDGRMFIWQENGLVRIFKNGVLLPTPFVDIRSHVNTVNDRGLLGLAFDPGFSTNGFVYLLYTYEEAGNPNNAAPKTARLTRVTASTSNPDVAVANSEIVLLGTLGAQPCGNYPAGSDCIPSDADSHTIGTLRFAPDGKLFVGIGDGAGYDATDPLALRAQDLNSYSGKILRVNKDGTAPGDNPFDDGTNSIQSKIYSYGLRNPYRFSLDPVTGELYLGDVGWNTWEEVNRGRGANFGWPCYEGHLPQPLYQQQFALCQQLPPGEITPPLYTYNHSEGNAVIGGVFYNATQYPAMYRGSYYFADYVGGFIRRMTLDTDGDVLSVVPFATGVLDPVTLELGPDGALYYISLSTGEIRRIKFTGPVANASANPLWGSSPLNVSFSSAGSIDPAGGAITYAWDFGDGGTSNAANPSHLYTSAITRTFEARLTVTDSHAKSAIAKVTITIGSTPPTATILSPVNGTSVIPGEIVNFQGMATDPDQSLPTSALSWQVLLHHNTHVHPFATATGSGGSFTVESHGEGVYSYEIILTATDSSGLTNTKSVNVPVSTNHLPAPWVNHDVGNVGIAGSASYSGGTFVLSGSGADIWDAADDFHYVFQSLSGDGEIVARVASLQGTHTNAKAGVMIREDMTSNARHAILNVTPSAGIEFMRRLEPGALTTYTSGGNEPAPKWLKLSRTGNVFSAYKSNNGTTWVLIGSDTINMASAVYIGMVVTSHNNSALCDGVLDNVSVRSLGTNAPPAVNITSPLNGATYTAPASITINANATDTDGTISGVDFFLGTTLIGTDTTAPYIVTLSNVGSGSFALTARATDNLGATTVSGPVNVVVNSTGPFGFADDFNDNTLDASKWTFGTIQGAIYTGPNAWDASIPVLERNQRLEISPRANVVGDHYNGYISVATWNLTNARATVEVIQSASGGSSNTQLALCVDSLNFYMTSVEKGTLRFEQIANGARSTVSIDYNAVQHRFWRIRHDPSTDSIIFETSSDGLTWALRRSVARLVPITALKVEISAGTWQTVVTPGSTFFDNFRLESNGGTFNTPPIVSITNPANGAVFTAPGSITINANATDSDGTVTRVDFYSGTTLIGTDNTSPYSFTWNNVAAGSYTLTAVATDNGLAGSTSSPISVTVNSAPSLPAPWLRTDIGSVGLTGDASFLNGIFTVRGSGTDIWDNVDAFQFVYRPMTGNGQIVARVTGIQFTDEWAKAGVMIRESLTPGSRHASMFLTAGNGLAFQRRITTGGISEHNAGASATAPYWVRLVRSGNLFTAYSSTNGVTWVQVGSPISIPMGANVFVGLAVTSHNNAAASVATFDGVTFTASRSQLKERLQR